MKKIWVLVTFFCFVLGTCNHYVLANSLILSSESSIDYPTLRYDPSGSNAWYPYYINREDKPGILPEVLNAILTIAKIKGEKRTFPPLRTIYALKSGDIDFDLVNLDWLSKEDKSNEFVYSDGFIRIKEYVVSLNKTNIKQGKSGPKEIGTVRGYYYHNDREFNRIDFSSERELIMALKLNRVSHIICGDRPAIYWSELLDVPIKFTELHSDGFLRIRLRTEFIHLLPKLNIAIDKINKDGTLEEIIKRYINDELPLP
jgi:ABC-type amino acid transport substrate-binding protein